MRALLIDNYDSYTYNLLHLLWKVLGEKPQVVRNDDPMLLHAGQRQFDVIVVSPGPGSPAVPKDVGLTPIAVRESGRPLLGVCLGHQLLGLMSGGQIDLAPTPRHGWIESIHHDGGGLFNGIPTPFSAVRYHSLALVDASLSSGGINAWSEDSVPMAFQDPKRGWYGVQFHPESICTEFGEDLVSNFAKLARDHAGTIEHREATEVPTTLEAAECEPPTEAMSLKVKSVQFKATGLDEQSIFQAMSTGATDVAWLDSSARAHELGRYSYMCTGEVVEARTASEARELANAIDQTTLTGDAPPLDFMGGLVGWIEYRPDDRSNLAARAQGRHSVWMLVRRFLALDHRKDIGWLVSIDSENSKDGSAWIDETLARIRKATHAKPHDIDGASFEVIDPESLGYSRQQYEQKVNRALDMLRAGESYEICLTAEAQVKSNMSGIAFYHRLRRTNPAPFGAYLRMLGVEVMSSSPERFVRVSREGTVEARPMKGTAARTTACSATDPAKAALETDKKTRSENLMIVDLLRNDIGSIAAKGAVSVPELMKVETYATVHQMVSAVTGVVPKGTQPLSVVEACFPPGSMTGAPKTRTTEIIDDLEMRRRGIYSGCIGYISYGGSADFSVVIRTAVKEGEIYRIGAGGAIVLDSNPTAEYEEMRLKMDTCLRVFRRDT